MNLPKRNSNGFTIIEVVLVLAIAGLIFLMIFIAFPALQRNQADSQRRSDVGRVVSQVTQYQTDQRGDIPGDQGSLNNLRDNYLKASGESFKDPSGDDYDLKFQNGVAGNPDPAEGQILYHLKAKCGSDGDAVTSTARKVAVRIKLGGGAVYCQNN